MRRLGSFIGGDKVIGKGKAGYFGILDMYIIYFMQFNKITSETSLSYLRCLNSIRRSIVFVCVIFCYRGAKYHIQCPDCPVQSRAESPLHLGRHRDRVTVFTIYIGPRRLAASNISNIPFV